MNKCQTMKKVIITLFVLLCMHWGAISQTDTSNELKPFYALYIKKKINFRWSVDLYALTAMKSMKQNFWLSQYNLGVNYKINRFYEASLGYSTSFYGYGNEKWWKEHYPNINANTFGTATFQALSLRIKRDNNIGRKFRLSNRVILQHYFPRFEKYQTRIQYNAKFSYRKRDLPVSIRPFAQGAIYYYLNGVPIDYFDTNLNFLKNSSPNGFHRYRIKLGATLVPIPSVKKLTFVVYYAINREFNLGSFGNNLNTPRPSTSGTGIFTSYQFNNYNIFGTQINYIF